MDKIFVTSSCQGADDLDTGYNKDGIFLGGPTYMYLTGIKGRPEWLADFSDYFLNIEIFLKLCLYVLLAGLKYFNAI